jgi:hypothetical protein
MNPTTSKNQIEELLRLVIERGQELEDATQFG